MKNLKAFVLATLLLFCTQKTISQNIYSGKLSKNELINLKFYLKKNISVDLDSVSVLSVNYVQPLNYCHYSKYKAPSKASQNWFANYFKENNIQFPDKSKFINIYYEEIGKKKLTPALNYYFDENHFFHQLLISKNEFKSCECFIILNKDGEIRIKYGEISATEIKEFVQEVSIQL